MQDIESQSITKQVQEQSVLNYDLLLVVWVFDGLQLHSSHCFQLYFPIWEDDKW